MLFRYILLLTVAPTVLGGAIAIAYNQGYDNCEAMIEQEGVELPVECRRRRRWLLLSQASSRTQIRELKRLMREAERQKVELEATLALRDCQLDMRGRQIDLAHEVIEELRAELRDAQTELDRLTHVEHELAAVIQAQEATGEVAAAPDANSSHRGWFWN